MDDKPTNVAPAANTPRTAARRRIRLPKLFKAKNRRFLMAAIFVLAVASAIFFGLKYKDSQDQLKHPEIAAKAETQSLVNQVSQITVLPSGEQPTVATVSDVSKLSSQTFFANAQNGDKVLIYGQAKKAFLYRPSTNKIINIAPLNVNSSNTKTPTTK